MAFSRRTDVGQAFRNNTQLQQFMLTDVTPTGRILGNGSYGSVEEVLYKHLTCAAKKLHETLIEAGNDGVSQVVHKYLQECQLMASLRHPNIAQFLGLCLLADTRLPLLVMERLETSLDDLLEHMPGLPLSLKRSVLEDVASGLVYLHDRQPPVIHRDLTAKNVLLTSSLLAKITDMGNSRIVSMRPGEMARTLSQLPGTLVYMPPEALDDTSRYGPSLDVFSFGHLALYTATQKFPGSLLSSTFFDPNNPGDIQARTEVERRREYFDLLEVDYGRCYPDLVMLVRECLHNVPNHRPATDEVLTRLQRMRVEVEGEYGGSLVNLDISKVLLAKEMKTKDRKIEELTQHEERHQTELEEHIRRTRELQGELEMKSRDLDELLAQLREKDLLIATRDRDIAAKDDEIRRLQREVEARDGLLQSEREAKEEIERRLEKELQCRKRGSRWESRCQQELDFHPSPGPMVPLSLQWRRGPDMPFIMGDYIQSVLVQGTVYVGGGYAYGQASYVIMKYDTCLEKWGELPQYKRRRFAMTVVSDELLLVGGNRGQYDSSKELGVWNVESKKWTHPYPEIPTARSHCSTVVCNKWLVVAGGYDGAHALSCVEVMNTDTKQWYTGPPTPVPWRNMKTVIVGDMCYFMGGYAEMDATDVVYSVSLPALISQLHSRARYQIWKEVLGRFEHSTPLSMNECLLTLGGMKNDEAVTDIHLYQPDTGEWVKVGDLPYPRCNCTGVLINNSELLVAGGGGYDDRLNRVDIARNLGKIYS